MAGAGGREQVTLDDPEVVEQGAFTEINIVPLVDIMLVLLVILMATSTAILEAGQGQGAGFRVQLPTASRSDELTPRKEELTVAILADGSLISRGEQVSMEELSAIFQEEGQKNPGQIVLVQADEDAIHKRVVAVMEAAREAGLSNLAIATRPLTP